MLKGMAVRNMVAIETVAVGNWSEQVELLLPVPVGGGGEVTHMSLWRENFWGSSTEPTARQRKYQSPILNEFPTHNFIE